MTDLPTQSYQITRADLVRYAGASGDFNPIHWSDRSALAVGLPGVIAHGMFTMALAGRAVAAWTGRPDAMVEYGTRFARPVVVPDDDAGATLIVSGVNKGPVEGGLTRFDLTVTCAEEKVLVQARALVRLSDDPVAAG